MAISLRLDRGLEHKLAQCARSEGASKSDLIRSLISDFVRKKSSRLTAWDLGKDVFGRFGSGKGNLSVDRKAILREKLNAKKNCR
jgi:RHH-type transcriptional regulator, rel operon repressor / antitoxin RelB